MDFYVPAKIISFLSKYHQLSMAYITDMVNYTCINYVVVAMHSEGGGCFTSTLTPVFKVSSTNFQYSSKEYSFICFLSLCYDQAWI